MKLLLLADIHGQIEYVEAIADAAVECDAILIAGDITDFGGKSQARQVLSALRQWNSRIFAVGGNCDLAEVDEVLEEYHSNLHGHAIELNGCCLIGVAGVTSCRVDTDTGIILSPFLEIAENAIRKFNGSRPVILVTHQPARSTKVDRTLLGRHVGNRAIRAFIEQYQPILAVSGHVHEACGVDTLGPTVLVNPGPFRKGHWALADIDANHHVTIELKRS